MQATQYDLARKTGLSQATISRALRGDPAVTAQTRARIDAACEELGYRPLIGGRLLAEGRRAVIGISLSRDALPTDRYVTLMYQALVTELDNSGLAVTLLPADGLEESLKSVGSVILIGVENHDPRLQLCHAAGVPIVALGYLDEDDVFSVVPDDEDGARQVVRHFHEIGRRRLVLMSSARSEVAPAMTLRAKASLEEAKRCGLSVARCDALSDVTNTLSGYRSARRHVDLLRQGDCLFCDTDEHALGAVVALEDMKISVPKSISVAGFDDIPFMSSRLTTVRQDFGALAKATMTLRKEAMSLTTPRKVVVPVKLIVRET